MKPQNDKDWESRLDRVLKGLPELSAPAGLVEKTMSALERRQKPAWHRQPWTMWPTWLRAVSLMAMLAVFAGICVIKWRFLHTSFGADVSQWATDNFSSLDGAFATLDALGRAAVTLVRHLNGWVVVLAVAMASVAYLTCIGLGTAAARLAFSRR